jgi:plastocyanin
MNGGVHQVAIYDDGTSAKNIDQSILKPGCAAVPVPLIDDPNGRIAVLSDQVCGGGSHSPSYQFDTPGRYLVICTFLPHFQAGMYGWVTVRGR